MTKLTRITQTSQAMAALVVFVGLSTSCQQNGETRRSSSEALSPEAGMGTIQPVSKGFLEVNGTKLWHEIYGEGAPLVVLHGGLMTIPEMMTLIGPLAKHRKLVAVELQGHGRSPDTDRPITWAGTGDDVASVIDQLKLGQADVAGLSFGAAAALRTAIQHPRKVRRLVVISTPYAKQGWYPKAQEGMGSVSGRMADTLKDMPTGKFSRQWPQPDRLPQFLDKMGKLLSQDYDWSADIKKLSMPVMLVYADHDSVSQAHIAQFYALLGGGIIEPGWENTKFTNARLAIVPGYSHYNFISAPELAPIVEKFLADPMQGVASGAAAASSDGPRHD